MGEKDIKILVCNSNTNNKKEKKLTKISVWNPWNVPCPLNKRPHHDGLMQEIIFQSSDIARDYDEGWVWWSIYNLKTIRISRKRPCWLSTRESIVTGLDCWKLGAVDGGVSHYNCSLSSTVIQIGTHRFLLYRVFHNCSCTRKLKPQYPETKWRKKCPIDIGSQLLSFRDTGPFMSV